MIQTTRCDLSTLQSADWDLVVKLYTDAEVRRFLGGIVDLETIRLRFQRMLELDAEHW